MKFDRKKNEKRMQIAFNLEEPDQVPIQICAHASFLTGVTGTKMSEYYRDPKTMLNVQLAVREKFNGLTEISPDYPLILEPSILGNHIFFPEDGPPQVKEPVFKKIEDIDSFELPKNIMYAGYMPTFIAAYRYFEQKLKRGLSWSHGLITCLGPFDTAALSRGITEFMLDVMKNPKLAKKLLEITTELIIKIFEIKEEICGELPAIKIDDDLAGQLPPKQFEELYLPCYMKIHDRFKGKGRLFIFHSDAFSPKLLDFLPKMGVDVFDHFNCKIDIKEVKQRIGNELCLRGNMEPLRFMLRGTPEDVERECKRQIGIAGPGGGYVLSTGGELARGTPPQNIISMVRAAEEYGKYALNSI